MTTNVYADKTEIMLKQFEQFFKIYKDVNSYLTLDEATRSFITTKENWIILLQRAEFPVAFFGSFSAGKSTIINAILRREILPEATKSTTAFPTIVRRGQDNGATVRYIDNEAKFKMRDDLTLKINEQVSSVRRIARNEDPVAYLKEIEEQIVDFEKKSRTNIERTSFHKLRQLLTRWNDFKEREKSIQLTELQQYIEDHPDALFIDRIDVFLTDIDIPSDVILVDLPGLAVSNKRHVQFTKQYIQHEAKAFVVCMKPKHLLEGQEIEFLAETNRSNSTVLQRSFWVINQWDAQTDQQRNEEEKNFWEKIHQQHFAITSQRFFKVSALNYFLLTAIAEGFLGKTAKLKKHLSNLRQIDADPDSLSNSPERATKYLGENEDVKEFARFQRTLFDYLNTTAKDEFLADARGDLLQVVVEFVGYLAPLYSQYQEVKNTEQEILAIRVTAESNAYVKKLQEKVRQFARQVRNGHTNSFWSQSEQTQLEKEIQRMLMTNRENLRNELRVGLDVDSDLSRLPYIVQRQVNLTQVLRTRLSQLIEGDFVQKSSVLLFELEGTDKNYLPDIILKQLEDRLSKRDITMRLQGLADNLLQQYGEKLEEIGFSVRDASGNTLDERINAALQLYQAGLKQFASALIDDLNKGIGRTIKNHAEYLEQELLRLFDDQRDAITKQVARNVNVSEMIASERQKQQIIMQAYSDLVKLRAELAPTPSAKTST